MGTTLVTVSLFPIWAGVYESRLILGAIVLAGLGTAVLFLVSVSAFLQRRTTQYALICAAVGALLFRSILGAGTVFGVVPMPVHHLVEHTLDFLIAGLVLLAAYIGRTSNESAGIE